MYICTGNEAKTKTNDMTNQTITLNAKEVKAALKAEGVKVISCKKGTGSVKTWVNLVVSSENLRQTMLIMTGLNIVDNTGKPFEYNHYTTSADYVQFYSCKGVKF